MNDLFEGSAASTHSEAEPPLSRAQRRQVREQRKRVAKRRRRALVAVVLAIVVIGGGGWLVWAKGSTFLAGLDLFNSTSTDDTADYPGPGSGTGQVTVAPGATGGQIGTMLTEAGVVASRGAFVAAFDANPDSVGIQPGTYNLTLKIPAAQAVRELLDLNNRSDYLFDLRPGYNLTEVETKLAAVTGLSIDEIEAAMADTAATGLPAEAGGSYEGWLGPKQYQFAIDMTATQMISEMVAATVTTLDGLGVPAADRQTVLTKASIVEKEAGRAEDKPKVASVIDNRLAIDMKLQMDSTVHYLVGGSSDASTSAADRSTVSDYNTYLNVGLPPTPIATPSVESIQAVLTPAITDYLYFVAVNLETKETRFAVTLPEHEANVALLNKWRAENGM